MKQYYIDDERFYSPDDKYLCAWDDPEPLLKELNRLNEKIEKYAEFEKQRWENSEKVFGIRRNLN